MSCKHVQVIIINMNNQNGNNKGDDRSSLRTSIEATHAMAKFLEVMGDQIVGRGVHKSSETPQERLGYRPQNPSFFGIQGKNAVPYDKIVSDGNRMAQIL